MDSCAPVFVSLPVLMYWFGLLMCVRLVLYSMSTYLDFGSKYLGDEKWTMSGVGEGAERALLEGFDKVSRAVNPRKKTAFMLRLNILRGAFAPAADDSARAGGARAPPSEEAMQASGGGMHYALGDPDGRREL